MKRIILGMVSTGFLLGYASFCPGTLASLFALLVLLLLTDLGVGTVYVLAAVTLAGFVSGICLGNWAEKFFARKDPREFVWDEITGIFAVSLVFNVFYRRPGMNFAEYVCIMTAGFVLFRIFDIAKPFPIKRAQVLHGGLGIMIDDILAGICAGLILAGSVFIVDKTRG